MIETLRIQNFKSIKDATVNLKDVNLLIGPNNSGKSNFFAALDFLKDWFLEGRIA
jgi:AAA15 family ATPase/GTPase